MIAFFFCVLWRTPAHTPRRGTRNTIMPSYFKGEHERGESVARTGRVSVGFFVQEGGGVWKSGEGREGEGVVFYRPVF